MAIQQFVVNGTPVSVEVEPEVRLLWVLRDLLGITGPKYGCGLSVCQACTSHINGVAFNPCAVPVGELRPDDEITTIEGLAASVGAELHPVQQAWLDFDVAQCGFCQPGQIMAVSALIERALAEGRSLTGADLDALENVCRCGTYPRIRAAALAAYAAIAAPPPVPDGAAAPVAPAAAPVAAPAEVRAASAAAPAQLPATGIDGALAPAAVAVGVAVAIRRAVRAAGEG
jgi:isoquinoline 1-oxidoreductase alpha subunit